MIDIPLSNNVTQGASYANTPSVVIRSDGTPINTSVILTNGTKLGLVQGILWNLRIDGYSTCVIETVASPGEFKALARDTTITVCPTPGYHPWRYLWDWYSIKAHKWVQALWTVGR